MLTIDELANHLEAAGSIDRASAPLGMYVAWCANLNLFSREFERAHEQLVLRVRYREITGSELLVAGCGGRLTVDMLTDAGRQFTASYYPGYLDDFRRVFGPDIYAVKDDWAHYDRLAPLLTRSYMHPEAAEKTNGGKRWWQVWR